MSTSCAEWFEGHSGKWTFFAGELTLLALRDHASPRRGCVLSTCVSVGHGTRFRVFFSHRELERQRSLALELLSQPVRTTHFLAEVAAAERDLRNFWRDNHWSPATSDADLAVLFSANNARTSHLLAHYQLSGSHLAENVSGLLESRRSGAVFDTHDVLRCLLAADAQALDVHRERTDWLALCEEWLSTGGKTADEPALARHAERYRHLGFGLDMSSQSTYSPASLYRKMRGTSAATIAALRADVHQTKSVSEQQDARASECAERLGLPDEHFSLFRGLARLSVARLSQRETFDYNLGGRALLMREIYRRLQRTRGPGARDRYRHLLSIAEIEEFLSAGVFPDMRRLRQRARLSVSMIRDGQISLFEGSVARRCRRELNLSIAPRATSTMVRGTSIAGRSAAFGTALVLRSGNVVDRTAANYAGRVLVTATVRPFMIPFCREAAAIVTEEGGLTSHAAVIARELGISCVVGAQNATRAFATGDHLFVSSRSGAVRKLSAPRFTRLQNANRSRVRHAPHVYPDVGTITGAPPNGQQDAPFVLLGAHTSQDARSVGGKATALSVIAHLVPPAIVLTTAGVQQALQRDGLQWLARELPTQLMHLHCERIAVRSSHSSENGCVQTFAGLFESVLDVPTADVDQCIAAIQHVIASASEAHVTQYAGEETPAMAMAVILQVMIEPVLSGGMLTSLRRRGKDWLVLEHVPGRLDRLMSGVATPARSAALRGMDRVSIRDLLPPVAKGAVSSEALDQLLADGLMLERLAGAPQEIEWAIDGENHVWILQTRSLEAASA